MLLRGAPSGSPAAAKLQELFPAMPVAAESFKVPLSSLT